MHGRAWAFTWNGKMIKTINSWRGLMAVVVVFFHSGWGFLWNLTYSGVTFFFMASAFLLAMRHPFERLEWRDYRKFVVGHAFRLYPLNWLALALLLMLALTLNSAPVDWFSTALSALLVQSWSPVHDVHYSLNPVAWFLSALLFCYAAYPLLARLTVRWRLRHKMLLAILLVLLLAVLLVPLDRAGREAVFVNPLAHVVDFAVGIALLHLCRVCRERWPRVGFATASLIEIVAVSLLALAVVASVKTTWFKPWEDVILWLLPQGAILLSLAWLQGQEGLVGRMLLWRPLQWLGGISFEVFALQFVAFHIFNYVVSPVAGHFGVMVYDYKTWCVWPVLLPLAWGVNRCFTRPVGAFVKRKIQQI